MRKEINWFSNSVIYHIFIDRFAGMQSNNKNKPMFNGGTINGIINKFDYLLDLNIDCIWLSPFYETTAYHGYHITNFQKIDSRFGSISDLKYLITKCHDNNIKIIIDFVPNHCSLHHPFFKKALTEESNYKEWFHFTQFPHKYLSFLGYQEIPKFNLANKTTAQYSIECAQFWIEMGIDGLRIDHAIGICSEFWENFKIEIIQKFPHVVFIGEVWVEGITKQFHNTINPLSKKIITKKGLSQEEAQLSYYNTLDGVLDFSLRKYLINHFIEKNNHNNNTNITATLSKHYKKYPTDYFLIGFLDNHDCDRMYYLAQSKLHYMQIVQTLFSQKQPIIIFYGDETGMTQTTSVRSGKPHADIAVRQNMNWETIDFEMLQFFKEQIKKHKAL